jgi:hypothetical protein
MKEDDSPGQLSREEDDDISHDQFIHLQIKGPEITLLEIITQVLPSDSPHNHHPVQHSHPTFVTLAILETVCIAPCMSASKSPHAAGSVTRLGAHVCPVQ